MINYLFHYIISIPILLALSGCFEPIDKKEIESEFIQYQKPSESKYIKSLNKMIDQISSYNINNNHQDIFEHNISSIHSSKAIFLGESHLDFEGKIMNLAWLNQHFRNNDQILVEGGQAFKKSDCLYNFLGHIYAAKKYVKLYEGYEPKHFANFAKMANDQFLSVRSSLDLSKISFQKAVCVHWDEQGKPLYQRNESMVRVMKNFIKNNIRVFVITGAGHVPEYYVWYLNNLLDKKISEGFDLKKNPMIKNPSELFLENKNRQIKFSKELLDETLLIKPIFDFFYNNNLEYSVVIPKKLFY